MQSNLPANSPPSRPTSNEPSLRLSSGLKTLLEIEASDSRAIADIRQGFLDEAKDVLPHLRAAATFAAGRDGVRRVIGKRFSLFVQPERSDAEWAAWWDDYVAVLADIPESALDAGMVAWAKLPDSEFLPKPGQLRDLAMKTPNRAARALERATQAIHGTPKHAALANSNPGPRVEPPIEDKASVADLMADFTAKMAAKRPVVEAPRNFPPPPIDERGVTAEMRRLMGAS